MTVRPAAIRIAIRVAIATLIALPALGAQDAPTRTTGLNAPDSILQFRRIRTQRAASEAEGVRVRYGMGDSVRVDVFIYPGPDFSSNCDSSCARRLLSSEGDGFVALLPELVRRQYIDSVGTITDSSMTPGPTSLWRMGRHIRFETKTKGEPGWSDFVLAYQPGARIKMRASYSQSVSKQAAVDAFVRKAVEVFVLSESAPPAREP
jgi:hypothetical protein